MRRLLFQQATVTRNTANGVDKYGNTTTAATTLGPFACRIEETSSQEHLTDRDSVMTSARLFMMPEADVRFDDVVTVDGTLYRVVGDPIRRSGFAALHHLEVNLMTVSL